MSQTAIQRHQRTLRLFKKGEEFRFIYTDGDESSVLSALVEMVGRRDTAFDWFDAAILSHQLGEHLAKELSGFVPKKVA